MKNRHHYSRCLATFVFVMTGPALHATTLYWDLNGATANTAVAATGAWNGTNAFWNTAATGTGGAGQAATTAADDLVFFSGTTYTTGTVTASGTRLASSITFDDNVAITLAGPVTVGGTGTKDGIFVSSGKSTATTVSGLVTLATAATLQSGSGALTSSGGINLGANALSIEIPGAGRITTSGVIAGTGAVTVSGSSTGDYVPGALHTYSGGTTLNAGSFTAISVSSTGLAGSPDSGCFGTGVLTLAGGQLRSGNATAFTIGNTTTISGDTTFYTTATEKSLIFSGPVTLAGAGTSRTLTSTIGTTVAGTSATFNGAIGGGLGIIKEGAGNITFNGINTYAGNTAVNAGILTIGSTDSLPGWNANGRFSVANTATLSISNGVSGANAVTMLGTTNFAAGATLGVDTSLGNRSIADNLTNSPQGAISLNKFGANTLALSGTNNYTGLTTVSAGTLQFANPAALYNGNPANWTPASLAVNSGTTLAVNLGGASDFSDAQVHALITGISANLATNGLRAGSNFGFDTTNAAGDVTYSHVLGNSTAGAVGFVKSGSGTLILDQANTYTGPTTVTNGTLTLTGNRTIVPGAWSVGSAGVTATLNIQGDLPLATANNFIGSGAGGTGIVNQTSGNVTFGGAATVLHFGSAGLLGNVNTATYNLSGGTLGSATSTGVISLGVNSYSENTFNLSATGVLNLPAGGLHIGRNNRNDVTLTNNTFNQTGGTATVGTLIVGGNNNTTGGAGVNGILNLTGGTFSATSFPNFAAGYGNNSSITIGDTAQVTLPAFPTVRGTGSTATLTFNGGTLSPAAASTAYIGGLTNAFIKAGGAKFEVPLNKDITVSQALLTDAVSTGGGLTKAGAGALTLGGVNTYTGATNVTGGILAVSGTGTLAATSGLSVSGGAKFLNLSTATLTLGAGAPLTLANNSSIGGIFGSGISAPGAASVGSVVNLLPSGPFTSGNTYTILSAASGLDGGTYQVLNPTNFTFSTAVTATSVTITPTLATALTSAYWKGGLTGNTGVWTASNGSTDSNWTTDGAGTNTPLVPGSAANIFFSDTGATAGNQINMTLGADMAINTLTVNGTAASPNNSNDINLLNSGSSVLTIGGAAGITVSAGSGNVTLNSNIRTGVAQTWSNNSGNLLSVGNVDNSGNLLTVTGTGNSAVNGVLSGAGGLTKTATGVMTLGGTSTYTGVTTVSGGTLVAAGGSTATGGIVVGNTTDNAVVNVVSGGTMTGASITAGTTAGSFGAVNVTGGNLTISMASDLDTVSFGGGEGGYGAFTMSSGTFTQTRFMFGGVGSSTTLGGVGVGHIAGGTVNTNGWLILARAGASSGVLTITAGTINHANAAQTISIGLQGSGRAELNVAGGLIDNTGRNVTFSGGTGGTFHWTGTGVANLNAGTLLTNAIAYDSGSPDAKSYVNFNGGTLKASSASTSFLPAFTPSGTGENQVIVNGAFGGFAGGAVIDTNGFDNTIGASLLAPTGNGVTSLSVDSAGGGYIGAPQVKILNGDNSPSTATGYAVVGTDPANLATFGKVTSVVITNPGNITGTPTVSLVGGGGTGAAVSVASTGANTSGGLAKLGAGTLTLTGTNTFTGATSIAAGGALQLGNGAAGNDGTIAASSGITNNGTLVFNRFGDLSTDQEISGSGAVTKLGAGTQTLTAANTYSGVTTVTAGTLVLGNVTAIPGGTGTSGGISALTFNGGVVGLGVGGFTRSLAAAGTATAASFTGAGGWAAYNADRVVNLGGASATVNWATVDTGFNGQTLILGSSTATHLVDLQNPIDLGTSARTIQVDNGAASIDAELSGILSGGTGGDLTKTGAGTLLLTGENTYTGATSIAAGTLVAGKVLSLPGQGTPGKISISAGATLTLNAGGSGEFTGSDITNVLTNASFATNTSRLGIDTTNAAGGFTYSPAIGGEIALLKQGANALTLNGNLTHTGTTTIIGGTMVVTGTYINANTSSNSFTVAGDSTVQWNSSGTSTYNGGGSFFVGSAVAGSTGTGTFNMTSGTLTIASPVAGETGSLRGLRVGNGNDGNGTLNLSGGIINVGDGVGAHEFLVGYSSNATANAATSAVGLVTVSGGELNVGFGAGRVFIGGNNNTANTVGGTGTLTVSGTGIVNVGAGAAVPNNAFFLGGYRGTGTLNLDGGTFTTARFFGKGGTATSTINLNGGLLKANTTFATFIPTGFTVNVRDGGARINTNGFDNTIASPLIHSAIGGDNATDGGLAKSGTGTLILTGVNTYTGATTINEGILALSGAGSAAESSVIDIKPGATLAISGISVSNYLIGDTTAQTLKGGGSTLANIEATGKTLSLGNLATLAPGSSPGTLALTGNLALANATILDWELNAANQTTGAGINDLMTVSNNLTLDGILNVSAVGGDFSTLTSGTWNLITYGGALTDNVLNLGTMPTLTNGYAWNLDTTTNGFVNLTIIPEPASVALLALGLVPLLRRRRSA